MCILGAIRRGFTWCEQQVFSGVKGICNQVSVFAKTVQRIASHAFASLQTWFSNQHIYTSLVGRVSVLRSPVSSSSVHNSEAAASSSTPQHDASSASIAILQANQSNNSLNQSIASQAQNIQSIAETSITEPAIENSFSGDNNADSSPVLDGNEKHNEQPLEKVADSVSVHVTQTTVAQPNNSLNQSMESQAQSIQSIAKDVLPKTPDIHVNNSVSSLIGSDLMYLASTSMPLVVASSQTAQPIETIHSEDNNVDKTPMQNGNEKNNEQPLEEKDASSINGNDAQNTQDAQVAQPSENQQDLVGEFLGDGSSFIAKRKSVASSEAMNSSDASINESLLQAEPVSQAQPPMTEDVEHEEFLVPQSLSKRRASLMSLVENMEELYDKDKSVDMSLEEKQSIVAVITSEIDLVQASCSWMKAAPAKNQTAHPLLLGLNRLKAAAKSVIQKSSIECSIEEIDQINESLDLVDSIANALKHVQESASNSLAVNSSNAPVNNAKDSSSEDIVVRRPRGRPRKGIDQTPDKGAGITVPQTEKKNSAEQVGSSAIKGSNTGKRVGRPRKSGVASSVKNSNG